MVIDARSGEVLHSRNADTKLHPASLTKMMTLYVVFDAVARGEISLDTPVRVSRFASREPASKLYLREGQRVKLRYLIRASAVKSANDAATAMAEAISGSEAAFADRMTRTARALGMNDTTFKNAHGLTQTGHMSTARDMTTLGRALFFHFPEYYNLFSRKSANAAGKTVHNTNRRLLAAYKGADGIKTGYTRAAGFNLVASAERGQERVIATVFGGNSGASRNARVAELLDMGFQRVGVMVEIDHGSRHPGLVKLVQHPVDEGFAAHLHHGLAALVREGAHTCAAPGGHGHGGGDFQSPASLNTSGAISRTMACTGASAGLAMSRTKWRATRGMKSA
jgi:D-alanyl-D-alanine carboxypeptidase